MLLILLACTPKSGDSPSDNPTYYADVRPVLDQSCARCHNATGVATSFDDPNTVVALADTMAAYTASGYMPPAAPDPECRDYEDSERFTITDEQIALFAAWAEAGAPLGDAADAPPPRDTRLESLAPYDLELWAAQPYTPTFTETDGNDYRCFLLDVNNADTTYVTGLQAMVDNERIVHHVVLFQPDGVDDVLAEYNDPWSGFPCSGLGQGNWSTLGAWGPGANPTVLPEGVGLPLPPQTQLILQMHYFNSFDGADQEQDQSGYGVLLSDSVERTAQNLAAGPTDFTIPANDEAYTAREMYSFDEGEVLAVWPHMHKLGVQLKQIVNRGDGVEECLLQMNTWDYHNQVTANFVEPFVLEEGDRVKVTCTYDNSAANPNQLNDPPEDVTFGEGTGDEMCFAFTLIAEPR